MNAKHTAAFLIPLISLSLFIAACTTELPPPTEFETAPLLGMIYDAEGTPVHNAAITIDEKNGPTSDINGRFMLPDLDRGDHYITVMKDGYEPAQTVFPFLNKSQILYLRMYNSSQLLSEAKKLYESKNYTKSMSFIDRALGVDGEYYPALYFKAVIAYTQGDFDQALETLGSLESMGIHTDEVAELKEMCAEKLKAE